MPRLLLLLLRLRLVEVFTAIVHFVPRVVIIGFWQSAKSTGSVDHKTSLVEGGQAEAIQNGAFPTLSLNDLDL